jgi:hypothetical protein
VEIIGEASLVHRHTSVLLDLKSRAYELEFMNVIVDEDPIIPYEVRAEMRCSKGSVQRESRRVWSNSALGTWYGGVVMDVLYL